MPLGNPKSFLVLHVDPKLLVSAFQVKRSANKVRQSAVTAFPQHHKDGGSQFIHQAQIRNFTGFQPPILNFSLVSSQARPSSSDAPACANESTTAWFSPSQCHAIDLRSCREAAHQAQKRPIPLSNLSWETSNDLVDDLGILVSQFKQHLTPTAKGVCSQGPCASVQATWSANPPRVYVALWLFATIFSKTLPYTKRVLLHFLKGGLLQLQLRR